MVLFMRIADIIVSNVRKVQIWESGCNKWEYIVDFPGLVRDLRPLMNRYNRRPSDVVGWKPTDFEVHVRELAHDRHECYDDCRKSHYQEN